MEFNAAQAFADLWALLCLGSITPHALFYRNWYGVITGLACGAYAHYHPGTAFYALFICFMLSCAFYLRALTREFHGKENSLHIVEFFDWAIEGIQQRINERRQAQQPVSRTPVRPIGRDMPPRSR